MSLKNDSSPNAVEAAVATAGATAAVEKFFNVPLPGPSIGTFDLRLPPWHLCGTFTKLSRKSRNNPYGLEAQCIK